MHPSKTKARVVQVERCDLTAVDQHWAYALENADAIDFHWDMRSAENPKFFNGRLRMLASHTLDGGVLRGEFLETGFKEFLYWREHGEPKAGVTDAFGSAIIRPSDGGVLLCRQRPGHINTGLTYLPGGFIDANDVAAGGSIDIAASSAREVQEEMGLSAPLLARQPGFLLTFSGQQLSIGVEYRCVLTGSELCSLILKYLAKDPNSELAGVTIVHTKRDVEGVAIPPFVRLLLAHVLP